MTREPRSADRFWKVLALAALLLSGWMAVRGGPEQVNADNGGAASEGLIALMGVKPTDEHLYLIDTNTKTIVMYETSPNKGFAFVQGRRYDQDLNAVQLHDQRSIKYYAKGYEAQDIVNTLKPQK